MHHLSKRRLGMTWVLSTLCVWMGFADASAQVVVNEFSCSNYSLGVGGNNEDFVEFFNPFCDGCGFGWVFSLGQPGERGQI